LARRLQYNRAERLVILMVLKHICPQCFVEYEEDFYLDIDDPAYEYYAENHEATALVCDECRETTLLAYS